jgi:uncharacterized protein with FMN-binding domain
METEVGFVRRVAPAILIAIAGGALLYALPSPSSTEATDEAPTGAPTSTGAAKPGTKPTTGSGSANQTVQGDPIQFRFGVAQAEVKLNGSTMTDITTVQAPGGRYQPYTDRAVPAMKQRILQAQSTNVAAVSGATYTSRAYAQSVQSALDRA